MVRNLGLIFFLMFNIILMASDGLSPNIEVVAPDLAAFVEEAIAIERIKPVVEDEYGFSPDEYEHYLKIIRYVNPLAYERLIECAKAQGRACIQEARSIEPTVEVEGGGLPYPDMIIRSIITQDIAYQLENLSSWANLYNTIYDIYGSINIPIRPEEREHVLNLIKSISPEAYEGIVAIDPKGEQHIKRFYESGANAAAGCSKADGWPVIFVTDEFSKGEYDIQQGAIGHELGHYILGHVIEHSGICDAHTKDLYLFDNAYKRVREYEADRAAVLDFGIDPKLVVDKYQRQAVHDDEPATGPSRETFTRTHPLGRDRAKQVDSLDRDIELRKRNPVRINWSGLASEFFASGKCRF